MNELIIISANGQTYIDSSKVKAHSRPCRAKEGHGWPDKEAEIIDLVVKKERNLDEGKKIEKSLIVLRLRHQAKEDKRKWGDRWNSHQLGLAKIKIQSPSSTYKAFRWEILGQVQKIDKNWRFLQRSSNIWHEDLWWIVPAEIEITIRVQWAWC